VVRGDMDLNETKLGNVVGAKLMRPATEEEISAVGAVSGFASPIGITRKNVIVVVDDAVVQSPNLVAGANEKDYHYLNVNYGRDFEADLVRDIAAARSGDRTADGNGVLKEVRGIEVGNIFKLGTFYSNSMNATFQDESGERRPVIMGSYGIGVGRLLACVAEEFRDDQGLKLPITIAPYHVHLVLLPGEQSNPAADEIYAELVRNGIEVLYDDRDERPGVKFNDADLIGIPLRLTVSKRSLENGGLEFKRRAGGESQILPRAEVVSTVKAEIMALFEQVATKVVTVPYRV
jgi:prolyl-tRNA synthetase